MAVNPRLLELMVELLDVNEDGEITLDEVKGTCMRKECTQEFLFLCTAGRQQSLRTTLGILTYTT